MGKYVPSAFFLVGPTAIGKSSVAHALAVQQGYEILSADSMLVYRGMDIGTAKPSARDRAEAQYHCIDLVDPSEKFNVRAYLDNALSAVEGSAARGNALIVTGGTGLYVKALTHGLGVTAGPDEAGRQEWETVLADRGVGYLEDMLKRIDPVVHDSLKDKQNSRRLIRALEHAKNRLSLPENWSSKEMEKDVSLVGLSMAPEELHVRIEHRVNVMYETGFLDEIHALREKYAMLSATAREAIGYAEGGAVIDGLCSVQDAKERTIVRTRQLAKRQRTWFRNQADVSWIDVGGDMNEQDVAGLVLKQWRKHGPTEITRGGRQS